MKYWELTVVTTLMLVTVLVKNRSPTSQGCHHGKPSPTSIANIDVVMDFYMKLRLN